MHHPWFIALAATALAGLAPAAPAAAQQLAAPRVILGFGPQQAAAPAPRLQQVAANEASPYGGGFLEMLFNGGHASSSMVRSDIPVQRMSVQRMPAQRMAAYEPASPQRPLAAVAKAMDPRFARQEVEYDGRQAVGTIVIDTPNKFLYLVEGSGRALRYGIGVGRPGFEWSGLKTITRKAEWPAWTPPPEMLLRRPDLPRHMEGGPANPLGSRAMYLGSSLYRIHGTNEPETIGTNVSSGCIRMINEDVMDLYNRVRVGTKVVVM